MESIKTSHVHSPQFGHRWARGQNDPTWCWEGCFSCGRDGLPGLPPKVKAPFLGSSPVRCGVSFTRAKDLAFIDWISVLKLKTGARRAILIHSGQSQTNETKPVFKHQVLFGTQILTQHQLQKLRIGQREPDFFTICPPRLKKQLGQGLGSLNSIYGSFPFGDCFSNTTRLPHRPRARVSVNYLCCQLVWRSSEYVAWFQYVLRFTCTISSAFMFCSHFVCTLIPPSPKSVKSRVCQKSKNE